MSKPSHEAIYIITATPTRGASIKQAIELRDFDEILCVPIDNAPAMLATSPPALAVIDAEGDARATAQLMSQMPPAVASLVMAEAFNEDLFLTCHDHGARDFLVKPVHDVYLVSRMIRALQDRRTQHLLVQKDKILTEMAVLSAKSGAYTTPYLIKLLKRETENLQAGTEDKLSLLILELGGYKSPLKSEEMQTELYRTVAQVIKECCRGFDLVGEYFMDKFAVILPYTGTGGATALAMRLTQRLQGYSFMHPHGNITLQVRIGLTDYVKCRHYEDLLNKAMENLRAGSLNAV